jgi:sialic acid synthase SpsE
MFYIFEMANNHQGSVSHAKKIIDEFSNLSKKYNLNAGIKLQFRNLDTFIHDDYKNSDLKYVKRFNDTRLTKKQFKEIVDYIHTSGMLSISTPFDNESLPMFDELGVEVLKIASCSVDDWPLLEEL